MSVRCAVQFPRVPAPFPRSPQVPAARTQALRRPRLRHDWCLRRFGRLDIHRLARARQEMQLLSVIWGYARLQGLTELVYPAIGMQRNAWKCLAGVLQEMRGR